MAFIHFAEPVSSICLNIENTWPILMAIKNKLKKVLTLSVKKETYIVHNCFGGIAQLGEHLICIQKVAGSIPVASTKPKSGLKLF
jgi:hypothetical protein